MTGEEPLESSCAAIRRLERVVVEEFLALFNPGVR